MTELPLAGSGCALDGPEAAKQGERYAALGGWLTAVERAGLTLTATFGAELDEALLEETIAVERGCCSFLDISFDRDERRLEIALPDAANTPILDAIQGALTRMGAWGGSTSST